LINVVLTDRDRLLFKALFEQRVLDIREIAKSFFPSVALDTVGRRLLRLTSTGYLKKSVVSRDNGRFVVYSLNKKAVSVLAPDYPFKIEEKNVRSNSIEHDIELFRIRKALYRVASVERYFTENMLQSCRELKDSIIFSAFGDLHSDAAIELNHKKKQFGAVELEISEKSLGRYRDKLSDYYSRNEIDFVIYISPSDRLNKNISKINQEFSQNGESKLHFVSLKDFYHNPKEIISNLIT